MRRAGRVAALVLLLAGTAAFAQGAWIPAKAVLAQHLLERSWRRTLAGEEQVRPWPWADTWPVARFEFPRLGVARIVLAGDSGESLAFGPGHTTGSALPGEPGTSIVSGHRDTHFALLAGLERGDRVRVQRRDGAIVEYRIDDARVVDARTALVRAEPEDRTLVLVTCWPFDALRPGGPLRWVLSARPAFPESTVLARRS